MSPGDKEGRGRHLVAPITIFVLAFLARMAFSMWVVGLGAPPRDDASQYDSIARSLAQGGDFTVGDEGFRAHRAPAYPFLLAGIYWLFGAHWAVGQVAQALIGATTSWLVYRLGSRLVDRHLGILAGYASALDPYSVLWAGYLLSEPLCALFTTASTWALLRAREDGRWTGVWAALCGLATLTRPNMAVLLPLGLIWLLIWLPGNRMRRATQCLVACAVSLLTLAPWTLRNYIVLHRWVPVTTMGGTVLWEANNPYVMADSTLQGHALHAADLPEAEGSRGLSEVDLDAYNLRLALTYLRTHPRDIPGHLGVKFLRVWNLFPLVDPPAFRWIGTSIMVLLISLLLLGLLKAWTRLDAMLLPLLMPIVAVTLTALIYWGDARIRAPAQPVTLLVAAFALVPARRIATRT